LTELNDFIRKHNALLFLRINKQLLSEKEYLLLNEEFNLLPSKYLDRVYLDESRLGILEFIYRENKWNRSVNHTKLIKQFKISKITAQKRIASLLEDGLILSKDIGRSKHLYITEKGKTIIKNKKLR
jgi:predicted transcriptional regulator